MAPIFIFEENKMSDLYLVHHGIKGQSWGERNGPPYPLDYKSHSTKEKARNPKSKIDGKEETKERKGLTDKQKKYIAIGTTAVAGGLLLYGGYKLGAFNGIGAATKSKTVANELAKYGISMLDEPEDISNTIKVVNRNAKGLVEGRDKNCLSCAFATELRQRGYDVTAKEMARGSGYNAGHAMQVFGRLDRARFDTVGDFKAELLKGGEGSRGILMGYYTDASEGAHFTNYMIKNNKVVIFDGQGDITVSFDKLFGDNIETSVFNFKKTMFKRTDDLAFDAEKIIQYVEKNDGGYYNISDALASKWRANGAPTSVQSKFDPDIVKKGYRYVKGTLG